MRATVFVGKKVMVFDPVLWEKNGGDSKTDSFMREATILELHANRKFQTADVKFHHDGRISKGHFTSMMEECPMAVKNDRP